MVRGSPSRLRCVHSLLAKRAARDLSVERKVAVWLGWAEAARLQAHPNPASQAREPLWRSDDPSFAAAAAVLAFSRIFWTRSHLSLSHYSPLPFEPSSRAVEFSLSPFGIARQASLSRFQGTEPRSRASKSAFEARIDFRPRRRPSSISQASVIRCASNSSVLDRLQSGARSTHPSAPSERKDRTRCAHTHTQGDALLQGYGL